MLKKATVTITGFLGVYYVIIGRFLVKDIPSVVIPPFLILKMYLIFIYKEVLETDTIEFVLFRWMGPYFSNLNIGFLFDSLSVSISLIVRFIAKSVIIFSVLKNFAPRIPSAVINGILKKNVDDCKLLNNVKLKIV